MIKKYDWILPLEDYMSDELVEEYGWKDAKQIALKNCSDDTKTALEQFIGTGLPEGMKARTIVFMEFDSTNPAHGCAHFDVEVEGTEEQHKALTKELGG